LPWEELCRACLRRMGEQGVRAEYFLRLR
jgi:hypothetical protein